MVIFDFEQMKRSQYLGIVTRIPEKSLPQLNLHQKTRRKL